MADIFSREKRSEVMRAIKGSDTSIELLLRKELSRRGIKYRKNTSNLPGRPDVSIKKYKLVVFCDGEFFHGKDWIERKDRLRNSENSEFWINKIETNMARDQRIDKEYKDMGYTVLRFWESDIRKNLSSCVDRIEEEIERYKMENPEEPKEKTKTTYVHDFEIEKDYLKEHVIKNDVRWILPGESERNIDISNLDDDTLDDIGLNRKILLDCWPSARLPRFDFLGYSKDELYLISIIDKIEDIESSIGKNGSKKPLIERKIREVLPRRTIVNKKILNPWIYRYFYLSSRLSILGGIRDVLKEGNDGMKVRFILFVKEKNDSYMEDVLSKYVVLPNDAFSSPTDYQIIYFPKPTDL